jgi:BirA family biotin operon repressor/biotin-[acetyl-CoA-carboxylase] ligase
MNGALARERRWLGRGHGGWEAGEPPPGSGSRVTQPAAGMLARVGGQTADPGSRGRRLSPWRLRVLPVCASTELELDRWLETLAPGHADPLPGPLAVIARRQRFGRGQQGRHWHSPTGGVWLSAALPWPEDPDGAAAPGLAVAVGLVLELEALGLEVRLKWPNDLLLAAAGRPAKLAGLLPRLRLRGGRIRWARIGLGLNGCNPVPPGATNLVRGLGRRRARPERLAARTLRALEWAMAMADQPQAVRRLAERRLLVMPGSWEGASEGWQPCGLADDGALLLARGEERRRLERRFDGGDGA